MDRIVTSKRSIAKTAAVCALLFTAILAAQQFDVVSIKRRPADAPARGLSVRPNGIEYSGVTVYECIKAAYGLADFQIQNAKADEVVLYRYDIAAKGAGDWRLMLRAMLADRFHLKFHREKKEVAVYELVTGRAGPKLRTAASEGEARQTLLRDGVRFERSTMPELADFLGGLGTVNRPVLDRTSLQARYDFALLMSDVPPDLRLGTEHAIYEEWGTIVKDVQQLGLELRRSRAVVEFFVVDGAGKATEN